MMNPDAAGRPGATSLLHSLGVVGLVIVVLVHLVPFAVRPALIGGDEPHYALMAHSLGVERDLEVDDEYRAVAAGAPIAGRKLAGRTLDRHQRQTPRGQAFAHPVGVPLLAAPIVALVAAVSPTSAPDIGLGLLVLVVTGLGLFAGLDLLRHGYGRAGIIAGLALYVSTPLWFYSRTLFTEPFLWSFAVMAAWLLSRGRVGWGMAVASILPWLKEPGVVFLAGILLVAVHRYGGRRVLRGLPVVAVSCLLLLAKNHLLYGSIWATPQPFQYGSVGRGLLGVTVDAQHGLLWFAPLAVVAALAWPFVSRAWSFAACVAAGTTVAFVLLVASWIDWTGGSCYGPRLLVPVIPVFAWPLAALWQRWSPTPTRWWLIAVAAVGIGVQLAAVSDPFTAFWEISITEMVRSRGLVIVAGTLAGAFWLARDSNANGSGRLRRTMTPPSEESVG